MGEQKQLAVLTDELIESVREHGIREISLEQYCVVCNRIAQKAEAIGGGGAYTPELTKEYLMSEEKRLSEGEICPEYLRFQKRVVRMMDSLAVYGKVDFSRSIPKSGYVVSDEETLFVKAVLDENTLTDEAKTEMDTIIRHIIVFLKSNGKSVSDVTDQDLFRFVTEELPVTNSGSAGRTLRGVKYFSDYIKKHGISSLELDFSQLTVKGQHVKAIQPFTREEMNAILNAIDRTSPLGTRDYAILLLGLETGLRGIDIRSLRLSDVDWRQGKIRIRQQKTSEPLILPIGGEVMNALADYILTARPETDYEEVFLTVKGSAKPLSRRKYSFTGMIAKYSALANVEHIPQRGFHSIRRTFATELSLADVPLETISQLLGHRRISEDKPYLSYNRDQIAFCAMGFDEIPLLSGTYAESCTSGGDVNDIR